MKREKKYMMVLFWNKIKKIEDYKSELINKNQENAKQQHQEFKNVLNNLENLYNSNKDKWINEIVERCLK